MCALVTGVQTCALPIDKAEPLAAPLPVPTSRGLPPPGRKDQAMEDASLRPATRPNLYVPRRSSRIALHAPAAILNMPRRHHQATLGNAAHHEIGRASCRERGCPYVSISGGAV